MARWGRKRVSKRAYAAYQKRVAAQQRDLAKYTINIPTKITTFNKVVNVPYDPTDASKTNACQVGCFALNIYECLRKSELYNSYSSMFDEFKINKVTVKLTPNSYLVNSGSYYKSLTVFTAWDRTGLEWDQVYLNACASTYTDGKLGTDWAAGATIDTTAITQGKTDGLYVTLGENVGTYSSDMTKSISPNSNRQITRTLYPTNLLEKSQYLSTDSLKKWYDYYDTVHGRYYGIPFAGFDQQLGAAANGSIDNPSATVTPQLLRKSPAIESNPCFLVEDNAIAFKPTLLVGIFGDNAMEDITGITLDGNDITQNPVVFNVEVDVDVQFRGVRKANPM